MSADRSSRPPDAMPFMPQQPAFVGESAGVPVIVFPPARGARPDVPAVLAWHLQDAPRTATAFAAAIPLAGLDAWRIYIGLPMSDTRLPPGGQEEFMRLGAEDAVMNIYGPVAGQAVDEAPRVLADVRNRFGIDDGRLALVGGSMGAAVAQLVIAEGVLCATAAVLISPLVQLEAAVGAVGRRFDATYPWSATSRAVADRLDFVARAPQMTANGHPAVLLIAGADDDQEGFLAPAAALRDALAAELAIVPGMGHTLADEPGTEPAPQTPHAARVDAMSVAWLARHLGVSSGLG